MFSFFNWLDNLFYKHLNQSTCPHHHFVLSRGEPYALNFKCKYCDKKALIPNIKKESKSD